MTDTAPISLAVDDADISNEMPDDGPRQRKQRSDKGRPRGPRGARKATSLARKIQAGVHFVAAGVMTVDPFDALILSANAEKLGEAWAPVIEHNPRIAAMFAQLERAGSWGSAVIATAGVVVPILAHHLGNDSPPALTAIASAMIPDQVREHFAKAREAESMNHRPYAAAV